MIIAVRLFYLILFESIRMFGSFIAGVIVETILDALEEWSINRAKKSQPAVIFG